MKKYLGVMISMGCLLTSVNADLVGVLDLSGRDNAGLGGGESSGNFASPKTFDAVSDLSLANVAWSDAGFSGVVNVSLQATAPGVGDLIGRGGKGAFGINVGGAGGANRTLLGAEEGAITLSNIQFAFVSGDALSNITSIQFAAVYIGNIAANGSESGILNGQAFSTGNGGGDLAGGRHDLLVFADSVVVESTAGGFSINGVDLAVTAVPEPTAAALLVLGTMGLFLRRRLRA